MRAWNDFQAFVNMWRRGHLFSSLLLDKMDVSCSRKEVFTIFTWIQSMDWMILKGIQSFMRNDFLDVGVPLITSLGDNGYLWIAIGVLLILTKTYRKQGGLLLVGLLVCLIVGNLAIKHLVARSRPSWLDGTVSLLIANPKDFSFPSGHTMTSVASATILAMTDKRFGYVAIPLAILISLSRLYLYVHFPSDVIIGGIIGCGIGYGVMAFARKKGWVSTA